MLGVVEPAGGLLLRQTAPASEPASVMNGFAALPLPLVISVRVRPDATDRSLSFGPVTLPSTAASSRCLISIQLALLRSSRLVRTITHDPCIRWPSMTNFSSPLAKAAPIFSKPFSGAQ